jgi:hypothetical protein
MVYLLLYVDDIVLIASSTTLLQQTISAMKREFTIKDLRPLHFLGVSVQHQHGLFLTQRQFALDILERAGTVDCKLVSIPVDTQAKVSVESGSPVAHPTHFRSLVGALQYLTFTSLTSPRPSSRYASTCMTHGSPPHLHEAHSVLSMGHPKLWSSPATLCLLRADGVPRCQPRLLVFKASERRLLLEYWVVANGVAEFCWLR